MTKKELRILFKTKRTGLSLNERMRLDDLMLLQFQQLNYGDIKTVLTYWPMANQAEPNTHLFSGYLRHMIADLILAYPKTDQLLHQINALAINEETIYLTNEWSITEPKEGMPVSPKEIDLVFVPLLAFDTLGYRAGYGKGFYDRYLSGCRHNVVKIGFSYFEPVDKITDTGDFDVPLSYCITPYKIYEF